MKKPRFDLTTDKALIFSAIMILIFTVTMIVIFFMYQSVPDTLIVSFFGCFGLEGGYCAFIHKVKKDAKMKLGELADNTATNEGDLEESEVVG